MHPKTIDKTLPTLMLLLDGVGDDPHPKLNGLTPLQKAHLPALDQLAAKGQSGLIDIFNSSVIATTVQGTLSVLGYNPQDYRIGRGIIEALGAGALLQYGDIALRGNLASFGDNGTILDRRAGRIREGSAELIEAINKISVEPTVQIFTKSATEHRLAVIFRGPGLSPHIQGSDPTEIIREKEQTVVHPIHPDDPNAIITAKLLQEFEKRAKFVLKSHPINHKRVSKGLLPANGILTRETGIYQKIPPISIHNHPIDGVCIAAERTITGIAKMSGMICLSTENMTANLDTNLNEKFQYACKQLQSHEFVLLHIKGCDIAAHDKQPLEKVNFLEKIDQALAKFLKDIEGMSLRIGVVADHCTSSVTGNHTAAPIPTLIYSPNVKPDSVVGYDEIQVTEGQLGRFLGHHFMEKLWQ